MPPQGTPFYTSINMALESVSNLGGGLKAGTSYDGVLNAGFAMNDTAIGLPEGGRFRITAVAISSDLPDSNLIGDFQGASNIEAQSNARVYDMWFRQDFHSVPLRLRFGIIDANAYFNVTDSAGELLNGSFGLSPGLSANAPISTYPKPGFGMTARYVEGTSKILAGIFNGNAQDRSLRFNSGRLAIAEWQQALSAGSTSFKLGTWECGCTGAPATLPKTSTRGVYTNIEHAIDSGTDGQYTLFLDVASSNGAMTVVPRSFALGIEYPAIFSGRPNDVFSAGLTRAQFQNGSEETSYEATYSWQLNRNLSIQPDYQYIDHPGGNLPAAYVLIVRLNFVQHNHF